MHTDDDIFESLDIHDNPAPHQNQTPYQNQAGRQNPAPHQNQPGRPNQVHPQNQIPRQQMTGASVRREDDIFEDLDMDERRSSSVSYPAGRPAPGQNHSTAGGTGTARNQGPASSKGAPASAAASGSARKRTVPRELNTVESSMDARKLEREKEKKRKSRIRSIILWTVLEVFTLAAIFAYGYILRNWNLIARPEVKLEVIENNNISLDKKKEMEGYWNIAVFGVDSRSDQVVGRGLNSDVIIVASINKDNGEIRLVSIFRDTYLNITDNNSFNKINQAYAIGGPEQALAALNKNLDLNIQNYVTFNWKAVADGINILGGVDNIPISKAELYYINAYITETVNATGIGSHQLTHTGEQHLDGIQAVAYGRLRNMDNDFARTERQRNIIRACFEKARTANFAVLNNIMVVCFPQVATNIGFNNIIAMAQNITDYTIVDTVGFPSARGDAIIGKKGDVVVPTTLESNVRKLHEFLFNDTNYTPSDAVLRYSQKIKEDSNLYKEGKFIDSVSTDGGVIQKPKVNQTAAVQYEDEDEEDEEVTLGVDENGNYIYPTDEDGNIVIPTDADGKVVYPTDEDGNIIRESTGERPTDLADDQDGPAYPDDEESDEEPGNFGPDGEPIPTSSGSLTNPTREAAGGSSGSTPGGSEPVRPGEDNVITWPGNTGSEEDGPGSLSPSAGGSTSPSHETTALAPGDIQDNDNDEPGSTGSGSTTSDTPGGSTSPAGNTGSGTAAPGGSTSGTGSTPDGTTSSGNSTSDMPGGSQSTGSVTPGSSTDNAPGGSSEVVSPAVSSDYNTVSDGPGSSSTGSSTTSGGPGSGSDFSSGSMPGVVTNLEPGGAAPGGSGGPG